MIDYIAITKHLEDKDMINTVHLQMVASYISGWYKYFLEGCTQLEIWINPTLSLIKLKGSISYFFQGHNFTFSNKAFCEAIGILNLMLKCNLWDAEVNAFEFGVIIEVKHQPKMYIQNHREKAKEKLIINEKSRDKGSFRWFTDKNVILKLYDAGKNIQYKQGIEMKEIIKEAEWNPKSKYLKWEIHYKRPHIVLNNGKELKLADLVTPKWNNILKEDLFIQYQRLIPQKTLILPTNKKHLTSADIILLELVENKLNEGYTIQEIKKILYTRINNISNQTLSENDKKARKRQVRVLIDNLTESEKSTWDLSDSLSNKIFQKSE